MKLASIVILVGCASAPPPAVVHNDEPTPVLHARWSAACQRALVDAAAAFRGAAPTTFPPYSTLDWKDDAEQEQTDAAASVRITPGRTWSFVATAVTDSAIAGNRWLQAPATAATWTKVPDTELELTRRAGELTLAIVIETERSSVELPKHPLVTDFIARMEPALDSCAR